MLLMLLFAGTASAQTTNIAKWDFGTSAFSRAASAKNAMITTTPFNITDSVIATTSQFNTSGNTGYFGQVGNWTNTATNSTANRTALTPRASTKSLYATFTTRAEATGDFSNLTLNFNYQRTATSAPTKVRAFLTWQSGTSYFTRYSSLISLGTTTSTTAWTTVPAITFSTGTTAFPSGTALANKNFLLELEFSTVSSTTNNINIDDITLTANSLCSNVQIGSTGALPGTTMGTAFNQSLSATGGVGSYTWSVVAGTLPPGITLNTSTGAITGTATSWGDFEFTIRAADSVGCIDDSDFTLAVAPPAGCGSLVEWDFSNYSNGQTVDPTSATPIVPSFLDNRVNATGIVSPSGVYLYGGSAACFYNLELGTKTISFTVSAPAGGSVAWDIVDLIFDFQAETASPTAMHIEVSKLNKTTGLYDKFYTSNSIPVPHYSLGFAHYRHSTTPGTAGPAAVDTRLNPGETFKYTLVAEGTVTNASMDLSGIQVLGCPVSCPSMTVAPSTLSGGTVGVAYNAAPSVSGGTTPYAWTISSGALPGGLLLNPTTGAISGTPSAAGSFSFTLRATGADGCSGATTYTVAIAAAPTTDFGDFSGFASASSTVNSTLKMGANVDVESAATTNVTATGDDASGIDDEDGLTMPATIMPGQSVTIPVVVTNNSGVAAYLDAWIDFNNNGSLTDSGEKVAVNVSVPTGSTSVTKNVTFTVPAGATVNNGCGARFRLTTTNNAAATAAAGSGEVEDYVVAINSSLSIGNLIWNDANDNGLKEAAESGINNVLVELWSPGSDNAIGGTSTAADTKVATTTTSGGGLYSFAGLSPGYYFVKVPTPPLTRTSLVVDNTDNGQDNDNNASQPAGGATAAFSSVIQLTAGQEPGTGGGGNADNTIDFGFVSNIGSPFACDNRFFVMQNAETSPGSGIWDSTLYYIDPGPVLVPTFIFEGKKLNGMAAFGGYLYCVDQNGNNLYRINSDGLLVDMGVIPGLPAPGTAGQWSGATALTSGKMILNEYIFSPASTVIYTIDLTSATLVGSGVTCKDVSNGSTLAGNFGDIAWDPLTNNTYGYFTNTPNLGLWKIDTTTGNCTKIASGSMASNGSLVIDANGLTYAYGGTGSVQDTLYVFNRTNGVLDGTFDAESSGPTVSNSDGAACPGAPPSMKIGNLIWNDANNNGVKDATEVGIDGVVVQLFLGGQNPATATPAGTTTTAGGGLYSFDHLSPGQYFIYIPTPPATVPLTSGTADSLDNGQDGDNNGIQTAAGQPVRSPLIALSGGTESITDGDNDFNSDMTVDFGFFGMSVGNLVWADKNNNGLKDAAELGIAGVTVALYNVGADALVNTADDTLAGTMTTDASGNYRFNGVAAGSYYVKVTPPSGYPLTGGTPVTTDNNVDNNNDGAQTSGPGTALFSPKIVLAAGTEPTNDGDTDANTNLSIDFGLFTGFQLGDLIWNDSNNNGIKDASESGIGGVLVELMSPGADNAIGGTGSNADTIVTSTSTNLSGNYAFTVYTAGRYYVRVTAPSAYPQASTVVVALDNGVDNDSNGTQTGGTGNLVRSPVILLAAGLEPGSAGTTNAENTIDFGLRNPGISIGDLVWSDANNNGLKDVGEPGLAGVTVELWKPGADNAIGGADDTQSGLTTASVVTDASGAYAFTGLVAGKYYIKIPIPPVGFSASSTTRVSLDNQIDNDNNGLQSGAGAAVNSPVITLAAGAEPITDGDLDASSDMTVDFGFVGATDFGDYSGFASASSTANQTLRLGASIDSEVTATMNATATGDDSNGLDDEDGVTIPELEQGGVVPIVVNVTNTTGAPAYLNGWIDYNKNNVLTDSGELVINNVTIATGTSGVNQTYTITVPANASGQILGARFRLTSVSAPGPTGDSASFGEVEDYTVSVCPVTVVSSYNIIGKTSVTVISSTTNIGRVITPALSLDSVHLKLGVGNTGTPDAGTTAGVYSLAVQNSLSVASSDINVGAGSVYLSPSITYNSANFTYQAGAGSTVTTSPPPFASIFAGVNSESAYYTTMTANSTASMSGSNLTLMAGSSVGTGPAVFNVTSAQVTGGHVSLNANGQNPSAWIVNVSGTGNATFGSTTVGTETQLRDLVFNFYQSTGTITVDSTTMMASILAPSATINVNSTTKVGSIAGNIIILNSSTIGFPTFGGAVCPGEVGIGNLIYKDTNYNGVYDSGEGVDGVTVKLFNVGDAVTGTPVATATTAGGGIWNMTGLNPGYYFVHIPAANFATGAPLVGLTSIIGTSRVDDLDHGVDNASPSVNGISSASINLAPNSQPTDATGETGVNKTSDNADDDNSNLTIDFGFEAPRLAVGNLVWNDVNNNGVKDSAEVGIASVPVQLWSPGADNAIGGTGVNADTQVGSTIVTSATGAYSFTGLAAGIYYVKVVPPTGYPLTSGTPVTTDNGVDNNNEGSQPGGPTTALFSPIITLQSGTEPTTDGDTDANTNYTVDFGLFTGFLLGDLVFNDANNNGIKDAAETGISGATVELLDSATSSVVTGTTTNSSGNYSFTVYTPGSYKVRVTPIGTYPLSSSTVGTDNGTDANNDGSQPGGQGTASTSFTFNLIAGAEPGTTGTTNTENSIDFGFRSCPTITLTAITTGPTTGVLYGSSATASGGTAPYNYTVSAGALPTWASLNPTSGAITGTPNSTASATFTIRATDSVGCTGTQAYTITPVCQTVAISPTSLSNGTLSLAYNASLSASGGTAAYTFTTVGTWPAGLSMSNAGVVSGTPTAVTSGVNGASVAVRATDANGCLVNTNVNIKVCPTITLNPTSLPAPTVGVLYSQTITQTGSAATPIAWSATGLPAWLSIASGTGTISGTPTNTTSVTFTVIATDANGCTGSRSYTITPACPAVAIGGSLPATATQTQAYGTQTLTASGGTSPYTWTVSSGVLPAGLTLTSGVTATTATVSGTPSAVGAQTFTIRAQDANGCATTLNATITVSAPPMSIGNLVWNDVNNNGIKDAAEVGISGLTVQLFNPGADNLVNTADDTQVGANTTTSVTGGYGFANLAPGKYYVKVTPSASYPATGGTPVTTDNDVDNNNDGSQPGGLSTPLFSPIITLTAGGESVTDGDTNFNTNFTVDFGLFTGMLLGDTVFNDVNNNGIKEAGESGIAGLNVELLNGTTSAVIATTTTNASGVYGFTVYAAGSYKVRVTPNASYPTASPTAGTDNATDANNDGTQAGGSGTASTSYAFNLTPGAEPGTAGTTNTENTIDFGFFMPTTDFGDFSTFADASSTMVPTIKLGAATDTEYTSTKNATATGDDTTGVDDEDGVTFTTLRQAQPATITVNVTNTGGATAYLNAWIDWNNNGLLTDAGEQIATNVAIAAGTSNSNQTLNITVPATATVATVGARFRFTDVQTPGPTGAAGNGEVEDYAVAVLAANTDFGDFSGFAPATSVVNSTLKLGANAPDAEAALTPNVAATSDDTTGTDDEDGVTFPTMTAGQTVTLPLTVSNTSGAVAYLNAWIDFNNNGVLTDSGEQIAADVAIANGTSGATQNIVFAVPTSAVTTSSIGARFRLTNVLTPGSAGAAGNGEVEDYAVTIQSPITDFGDWIGAADAWNSATSSLRMGALVDSEYASIRNATATGDDLGGTDDEDGVVIPSMTAGQTVTIPVTVTNTTGAGAFLNAWIDYNNNGSFSDAGEQVATNTTVATGSNGVTQNISVNVPTTATTGLNLGVRFRLTATITPGPTGGAGGSGEVEDYVVNIAAPTTDFGDFSTFASASSTANANLKIGTLADTEFVQTANVTATGDDITGVDDEDGVTIPSLTAGATVTIPVIVTNNTGAVAYLNAWIDYNNNGVVTDAGEQIATNVNIATGTTSATQNINITVPTSAVTGTNLGVRFRLTSVITTTSTGASGNGEVEDYVVNIAAPTTDFGDFSGFADASNGITSNLKIGTLTDAEFSATKNVTATGDDTTGSDDEDGVTIPAMMAGAPATIPVIVTNTTGAAAFLNAWIDYNNNGVVTDAGEQIASNVSIATGTSGATQNISITVPANAVTGINLGVRVRLTSTANPGATGTAGGSGEVEDYVVNIAAPTTDFGDFSTFASASSAANSNLKLGALTDTEFVQTVNLTATGDDTAGSDDEDGVTLPTLTAGGPVTIPVVVTNNTGAVAYLNAWIDYNNNGVVTDAGEQIATNVNIPTGTTAVTQNINITVPTTAVTGLNLGARFRLTSVNTTTSTGASGNGEVEDYVVNIAAPTTDFGDFTGFADASNGMTSNLKIGTLTDAEFSAAKNVTATGDDTTGSDDEDGVTIPAMTAGAPATIPVNVTNTTGAAAYLNAWIDYNNNGVVTDAGEQIATNVSIATGTNGATQNISITVPANAVTGINLGVRVRLTSTANPGATGTAGGSGEVEDYVVNIAAPTTDFGDYSTFVSASSTANGNLKLGALTDTEYAQTANATATGDDTTGVDDEDSVTMPTLTAGGPATIPVIVTNNTGAVAYLNAWIDYNNNGVVTDAGEQIATNVNIATGTTSSTQNISITVPASAVTGTNLGVRFRLTSVNTTTSTGASGNGEVEDYVVNIAAPPSDFGDWSAVADASSAADPNLKMGALVDTEFTSTRNATATGDDNTGSDDEDGVTMPSLMAGAPATIPVVVTNNTGAAAYLNAWIDYNNNGSLADAGEQIATNVNIATGTTSSMQNISITVPASAVTGTTLGLRFRLTSTISPGATGSSGGSGEVEDYVTTIATPTTDFGDLAGVADAWSTATSNLRMGSLSDTEYVSTLNATATGDDTTGSDDEDGVTVPASLTLGAPASITVNVTNTTGAVAYLNAWIDYNHNGSFTDAGEQIAANTNIATGSNGVNQTINFTVPVGATLGTTGIRIRLTSVNTTTSVGASGNGEVEDYVTNVVIPTTDFGDFATFADASSTQVATIKLGATTDTEYVSTKNATATGDDTTGGDDEDGVTMLATINTGATVTIPVVVTNTSGAPAYLNGWIDYDNNGTLIAGEQIATEVVIANGTNGATQNVTFTVPSGTSVGAGRGVRFRLTSTITPGPTGASGNGEVEDYTVQINQGLSIGNIVWYDVNNNGTKDGAEAGIDGVTVQLYTPGVDGIVNNGDDVLVASTTTSGGGLYSFVGLSPADYFVKATPPVAYQLTSGTPATTDNNVDNNNDGAQPGGLGTALFSPKINLAVGAESITDGDTNTNTNLTVDFGLFGGVAVGNLVWNDANNNGLYDSATESGISGLAVELLNGTTNAVITSTTTNASGVYGFKAYTAGSYKVRVTPNGSFPLATTAVNLDNGTDNDSNGVQATQGTAATSPAFTLTFGGEPGTGGTGNAENTIDFGFRTCPTITVNPSVLADGFVNTTYSQTLSSTGGIGASTYAVSVGSLPTWATLDPNTGIISGTPNATGTTSFTIRAMDSVGCQGTRALSITVRSLKVGNLVWSDTNNNGVKDTGENGITGITVELWSAGVNTNEENGGGDDVKIATDVVTNASGIYSFTNVPVGSNYYVRIPTPPFTNYRTGGTPVTLDNSIDNDNNGQQTAMGAPVRSPKFALAGGAEPAIGVDGDDADGELTIDFGLTPTVGVGNLVFKDMNNNGFYDAANDTVVDNVTLQLFTSGSDPLVATPVATTTTAGGGLYLFYALPGSYFIYLPAAEFLPGGDLENTRPSLEPVGVPVVDDNGDQNALATAKPSATGVSTGVFTLTVGAAPTTATGETGFNSSSDSAYDANADLTIDLGFYPTGTPGFPLAGRVSRTLTPVAQPSTTDQPLTGVTVSLYSDANADGVLQTDEMSAVAVADTSVDGSYEFTSVEPGDYLVVQSVLPGAVAAFDTDGGNKECTAVSVTDGEIAGIDFLQCIAPDTFTGWQTQNALGGANAAGDNPDGDLYNNLLEYALGMKPGDGMQAGRRFWIESNAQTGLIDAVMIRPTSGHQDVSYTLEGAVVAGTWQTLSITPVTTSNSDGTETVRFGNLESAALFAGATTGYARLKVSLDADQNGTAETSSTTPAYAWSHRELAAGSQTFSMPLLKPEIFAGKIGAVNEGVLDVTSSVGSSSFKSALVAGRQYFVEVIDGVHEGHRFEIDESASTAAGIVIDTASGYNTLTSVPATLADAHIVVREHWTIGALFPISMFQAASSSSAADRVMFFDGATGSYQIYWLYNAKSGSRWTKSGDATLADAGSKVVGPAEGVMVHPRTSAVNLLLIGQVRGSKFATPLKAGAQLVGSGWPSDQSPADRSMTLAGGFAPSSSATVADRIRIWLGDATPGASGYENHFFFDAGASGGQWTLEGDATQANRSGEELFRAFRAAFLMSTDGASEWVQPKP